MAVIPGKEVMDNGYVEGLVDPPSQVQPAGVDLSLMKVERFSTRGTIGMSSATRELSSLEEVVPEHGLYKLPQGCFKVTYNEIVHVPIKCVALSFPRSSLLRCGVFVGTAVWDPGYMGRGSGLLVVHNPEGFTLEPNARLVQIVFFELSKEPDRTYQGIYQNENLSAQTKNNDINVSSKAARVNITSPNNRDFASLRRTSLNFFSAISRADL